MDEKQVYTPFSLYKLGSELQCLNNLTNTSSPIREILPVLETLVKCKHIRGFEDIGEEAENWYKYLSNIMKHASSPKTMTIYGVKFKSLQITLIRWDTLIEGKLKKLHLTTPEPHTNINHENLSEGIKGFIADDFLQLITAEETRNLDEACVCILIGGNTASEFMSLRTAESLLRRWYIKKTDKTLNKNTWGYVLEKLTAEYPDEKDRPKEIQFLSYLNKRRNEIAHPERTSTQNDAEVTLLNIIDLIESLKDYLKDNGNT